MVGDVLVLLVLGLGSIKGAFNLAGSLKRAGSV